MRIPVITFTHKKAPSKYHIPAEWVAADNDRWTHFTHQKPKVTQKAAV